MKRKKLLEIANDTFTPTDDLKKTTASNFIVTDYEGDWYVLALQRAPDKDPEPNHWGLPGGGVDDGETLLEGAIRETSEEAGHLPHSDLITPLDLVHCPEKNKQYLYTMSYVPEAFIPDLESDPCHEHQDYQWVKFEDWPEPAHQRVKEFINDFGIKNLEKEAKKLRKTSSDKILKALIKSNENLPPPEEAEIKGLQVLEA